MNYTLHLTDSCNLNCKYCYENKKNAELSFENIKKIIDYEISRSNEDSQIIFYGGEPLLKKNLIYDTIEYIKSKKAESKFRYGITTNGMLLDDEFIKFIKKNKFASIAYSFDGSKEVHDLNRIRNDGNGSYDIVSENARKLLDNFENIVAMVVATKNNINKLAESTQFLLDFGFEKINILLDYSADWQDEDLEIIRTQFSKVVEIYYQTIKAEDDIDIPLFESKISTYIDKNINCNDECIMGRMSVNVGTDGNIYPCVQFVGVDGFKIGDCENGIDNKKANILRSNSQKENEICKTCAINRRCKHTCACRNYLITKDINEISPIICEVERIVINVADNIASRLYNQNSKLFLQKFYNENYSLIKSIILSKK